MLLIEMISSKVIFKYVNQSGGNNHLQCMVMLMQLKLMEVSIGAFNDGSKGTNYYWYYFNSVALHLHQSISLENISSFSIAVFALGTQHYIVVSIINTSSSFTIMCLVAATLYPSAMIVLSKFLHFDGYSSVLWLTS